MSKIVIDIDDMVNFIVENFNDSSIMDDAYCKECGECRRNNHLELSVNFECECSCKLKPEELARWFIETELEDYIVPFS